MSRVGKISLNTNFIWKILLENIFDKCQHLKAQVGMYPDKLMGRYGICNTVFVKQYNSWETDKSNKEKKKKKKHMLLYCVAMTLVVCQHWKDASFLLLVKRFFVGRIEDHKIKELKFPLFPLWFIKTKWKKANEPNSQMFKQDKLQKEICPHFGFAAPQHAIHHILLHNFISIERQKHIRREHDLTMW